VRLDIRTKFTSNVEASVQHRGAGNIARLEQHRLRIEVTAAQTMQVLGLARITFMPRASLDRRIETDSFRNAVRCPEYLTNRDLRADQEREHGGDRTSTK